MTPKEINELKASAKLLTSAIEDDWQREASTHTTDYWMRCAVEMSRAIPKLVTALEADRDRARDAAVALEQENARLTDDLHMHETVRRDVEKVLDVALGPFEEDGAGAGLGGDVMLLAERARSLTEAEKRLRELCEDASAIGNRPTVRMILDALDGGEVR